MSCRIATKVYGIVSAERQQEMSGLEFVQGLADGTLPLNTMAETLGYDVSEAELGRVLVTALPDAAHLNPTGTVHGGLAATMLDSCMGLAIRTTLEKGFGSTTLEFKISLVRPITPETGLIAAEGLVLNCGRRIGTAEGRITDRHGRLLAHVDFSELDLTIGHSSIAPKAAIWPGYQRNGSLRSRCLLSSAAGWVAPKDLRVRAIRASRQLLRQHPPRC
jgi:uncharacterized protein (TIGR00369 family)